MSIDYWNKTVTRTSVHTVVPSHARETSERSRPSASTKASDSLIFARAEGPGAIDVVKDLAEAKSARQPARLLTAPKHVDTNESLGVDFRNFLLPSLDDSMVNRVGDVDGEQIAPFPIYDGL